jgi:chorismate mutase/prephenate dehydratase
MTNTNQFGSLDDLRQEIDKIDRELVALISSRARCAQAVAEVKKIEIKAASEFEPATTTSSDVVYYRPEREAQVLRKVMAYNEEVGGPLTNEEMARLFREIMSACLALEQPIKVAFLGPEGTFTHQAVGKHFGHSAVPVPMNAIDEVFREVEAGAVHYGVVPVENSTEGVVTHTLDSFIDSNINICGEVVLRIHHNLLVSDVTNVDKISRIYSHPQSLAQCRKWLDLHYPSAERVPVSSNAEAALRIKGEWSSAAIAGMTAAKLYGLHAIEKNIEDAPDNSTRFLVIGTQTVPACGQDKTSLVISARNKPGALHYILEPFHRLGVDLTRLQSRPSRSSVWNYIFFIDIQGHQDDENVAAALMEVANASAELKVLGSYPTGVL